MAGSSVGVLAASPDQRWKLAAGHVGRVVDGARGVGLASSPTAA